MTVWLALALVLALVLGSMGGAGAARAEVPRVATDIPPVHGLAARVMAGLGTPDLIIRPGASPHGYALRPSEAAALQAADLVFFTSADLTPWLVRFVGQLGGGGSVIELQSVPGSVTLDFRHRAVFGIADGDTSHDGDHDAGHDDGDHGHDEHDPHAWLDPENAKLWLGAMAEALAARDPGNAQTYRRNAELGAAEIDQAMRDAQAILAPVQTAGFVVFHDTWQYFEHRFGLNSVAAISLSDASAPGPKRVRAVRDAIRAGGVVCVFSEPQFDLRLVRTVFEGSAVRLAELDPLGVALDQGPGHYPALIRTLATEMAACLGAP